MLLITHDLGVVARMSTTVAVMYAGEIVETGTRREVFRSPAHPYTRGLLASIPVPGALAQGAAGIDRRQRAKSRRRDIRVCVPCALSACTRGMRRAGAAAGAAARPQLSLRVAAAVTTPLLEARGVNVTFQVSRGWLRTARPVHAVRNVGVALRRGEVLGIVGESGSGKSTLAAAMLNSVTGCRQYGWMVCRSARSDALLPGGCSRCSRIRMPRSIRIGGSGPLLLSRCTCMALARARNGGIQCAR